MVGMGILQTHQTQDPSPKEMVLFVKNLRYQVLLVLPLGSAVLYSHPLLILSYYICRRVLCSWKEDQGPSQVSHCKINSYSRSYSVTSVAGAVAYIFVPSLFRKRRSNRNLQTEVGCQAHPSTEQEP